MPPKNAIINKIFPLIIYYPFTSFSLLIITAALFGELMFSRLVDLSGECTIDLRIIQSFRMQIANK